MALAAEAAAAGTVRVTILPVGLTFRRPGTFRTGRATAVIGPPVSTDGLPQEPQEAAVRALTERIGAALRALIVEAGDRQTLRLVRLVDRLLGEADQAGGSTTAASVARLQRILRGHAALAVKAPGRVDALRTGLERYARDLQRAGPAAYRPGAVLRDAVREGLVLACELPIALWGLALHFVPYQLTALVVRWLRPEADLMATYKVAAGAILYPLCWAAELAAGVRVAGPLFAVVFAGSLVPAGFVALAWHERLARVRRDAWRFVRFLGNRDLHRHLAERRGALVLELEALAALVPAEVLKGWMPS
jgi:hypothetical protein